MKKPMPNLTPAALSIVFSIVGIFSPVALAQVVCLNCGTEWTQMMNNSQLVQQYKQLVETYNQLKREYEAITGAYGKGQIGLSESVQAAGVVPGSWQDVVARQASGAYGSRQKFYEDMIKTMPSDVFQAPDSQRTRDYKMSTDSVRAALAGGDALFGEVQTHLQNLQMLSQQVDSTKNIKDAADLQNRISTENGMLSTAMGKISAMNMNLQANLLNRQNQATSNSERYFRWDDSNEGK